MMKTQPVRAPSLALAATTLLLAAGCGSSPAGTPQHVISDPDNDAPNCADWVPPSEPPDPPKFDCSSLDASTATETALANHPECDGTELLDVAEAEDDSAQSECEVNQAQDEYDEAKKDLEDDSAECSDNENELNMTPQYVPGPNGHPVPNCTYQVLLDKVDYYCGKVMGDGEMVHYKLIALREAKEKLLCDVDKLAFATCKWGQKLLECHETLPKGTGAAGSACSKGSDCASGVCSLSHYDATTNTQTGTCGSIPPGPDCCVSFANKACSEAIDPTTGSDPDDNDSDGPTQEDGGPDPTLTCVNNTKSGGT